MADLISPTERYSVYIHILFRLFQIIHLLTCWPVLVGYTIIITIIYYVMFYISLY